MLYKCACTCGNVVDRTLGHVMNMDYPHCGCIRSPHDSAETRFWRKVQKTDGCWLWMASKNKDGYGEFFGEAGKHISAHRFSYFIHYGEIPAGMCVCHECDNPSCVKPEHLFLGTVEDNRNDKLRKNRQMKGERFPLSRLKESQVLEIVELSRTRQKTMSQLAADYGVSNGTIGSIMNGDNWAWLTGIRKNREEVTA